MAYGSTAKCHLNCCVMPMAFFQLTASDTDEGPNGLISYSIVAGSRDHFIINNRTGLISVAPGVNLTVGSSYALTVKATDNAAIDQRR